MPRFVILTHDCPTPHWDFLVEAGGVLSAWRLHGEPCAGTDIPAEPNADHRLLYLDYQGPVSGGRGNVTRWDAGYADWVATEPDRVAIDLHGTRLTGRAVLRSTGHGWVMRVTAPG